MGELVADHADIAGTDDPVWVVLEAIESVDPEPTAVASSAAAAARLLEAAPDAYWTIRFVLERDDVLHVLERARAGLITRTGFLNFVLGRPWPPPIKAAIEGFSESELSDLESALRKDDLARVTRMLHHDSA